MILLYAFLIIFDVMSLSSLHPTPNMTTNITVSPNLNPNVTPEHMSASNATEIPTHLDNATYAVNSTTRGDSNPKPRRLKRSLPSSHHHGKRKKSVPGEKTTHKGHSKKESHKGVEEGSKNSKKEKHHKKHVDKDAPASRRKKRSSFQDQYVGDSLFALELFLLFIPLACSAVVVLSLMQVCWTRTCRSRNTDDSEWTSDVDESNITLKKKVNLDDLMAGGDPISKRLKLDRVSGYRPAPSPGTKVGQSTPIDNPSSYVPVPLWGDEGVYPVRGQMSMPFSSVMTFDSHIDVKKKLARKTSRVNHPQQVEPLTKVEVKGSRGKKSSPEEPTSKGSEQPKRTFEVNKRSSRLKTIDVTAEDSSKSDL